MTRKRTRESLERMLCEPCKACNGRGTVKTPRTVAYEIFREILREARQFNPREFGILVPPAVLELLQASDGLDMMVVPVGGGGLAAGTRLALQAANPAVELLLAEPLGAADTARSLAAGERRIDFTPDTVCDGLRGTLGAPNFALLHGAAEVITVADDATIAAMRLIWQVLKQVVEPSSAIALAAILAEPARFAGKRVGVVLSSGNVDLDALPWGAA